MSDDDSVWVRTEPTIDGRSYVVLVEFGQDEVMTLKPHEALTYARDLLTVIARAEHDAAVFRQVTDLTKDKSMAGSLVVQLRKDRGGPLTGTDPAQFEAGVALRDDGGFHPFITVSFGGKPFGQWEPESARSHAAAVIEASAVRDLDEAYLNRLISDVGIDRRTALKVVHDLQNWRE